MRKILNIINNIEELFLGYVLLIIAFGATYQVVMRYFFSISYDWFEESARYVTVLITFVGAGLGVKYGTHFSMEALTQYAPDRVAHFLKTIANLVSATIMAIAGCFGWQQVAKLYQFGVTTSATQIPMFIPYLPIAIFSFVISFRFFVQAIRHGRSVVRNEPFARGRVVQ